jgi:hypothetical protein
MVNTQQFQSGRVNALEGPPLLQGFHVKANRALICVADPDPQLHPPV